MKESDRAIAAAKLIEEAAGRLVHSCNCLILCGGDEDHYRKIMLHDVIPHGYSTIHDYDFKIMSDEEQKNVRVLLLLFYAQWLITEENK